MQPLYGYEGQALDVHEAWQRFFITKVAAIQSALSITPRGTRHMRLND